MKCGCEELISKECQASKKCIKDLWLFESFDEKQMETLKRIGLRRVIKKGESVFIQGDQGNEMFLIKTGRIKLCKIHEDGSEVTLDFRKAGDVVGENIFSSHEDYPLTAWAMEDTITCGFNRHSFNKLVISSPDIGLKVIESMSAKMSSMAERLESMAENSLENRLFNVLLNIAKEHGTKLEKGYVIQFPLTHEELGFLVGAHRVSITKVMSSLFQSGKIIKKDKNLLLPHGFL